MLTSISSQTDPSQSLWAITTYFNPVGYRSRRENYRIFRRHLPIPLIAVRINVHNPAKIERFRRGLRRWRQSKR